MNPVDRVMQVLNVGATGLARVIGADAKRQHVEYWRRQGRVPPAAVKQLVRAADGALREWDFMPNDWHRIWPELIDSPGAPCVPPMADAAQRQAA